MFDEQTIAAVRKLAAEINVRPEALLAVAEVESAGQVFALVSGRREPLIRWEGHYFFRRLSGAQRDQAVAEGLASSKAGGVKNPREQADRWKIILRAAEIDPQAAFESASYGVGQVMGAHWAWLGFPSVQAMVNLARRDAAGQVEIMARFIKKSKLDQALRDLDFTSFARGYNGPGFKANGYHTKMAAAYERLTGRKPVSAVATMLRMGSKGERVREVQTLLTRAGHPVKTDGDFGEATRDAVMAFQRGQGIQQDGVVGPETNRRLTQYRQTVDEQPGRLSALQVPAVSNAAKGIGVMGGAAAVIGEIRDQIAGVGSYLFGLDYGAAQTAASALMSVAGAIGLGLALYGLWGFIKSRRTDEGDI